MLSAVSPRLGLLFAAVVCLALPVPSRGQGDGLAALDQLLQRDPAAGFQEAWRMFQGPARNGDLDGMVAITRLVAPQAGLCQYSHVHYNMLDVAVPAAQAAGRWDTLGELFLQRAGPQPPVHEILFEWRGIYFTVKAADAYAKSGTMPEGLEAAAAQAREWMKEDRRAAMCAFYGFLQGSPGYYVDTVCAAWQAYGEGRDGEAIQLVEQMIARMAGGADPSLDDAQVNRMLMVAADLVAARGGEVLVPLIRAALTPDAARRNAALSLMARGCALGWDGRGGALRAAAQWALGELDPREIPTCWPGAVTWAWKAHAMGRPYEAWAVISWWLDFDEAALAIGSQPDTLLAIAPFNPAIIMTNMPAALRHRVVEHWCRIALHKQAEVVRRRLPRLRVALAGSVDHVVPDQRPAFLLDVGMQLLRTSTQFIDPVDRDEGITEAARFLEQGGRTDLADRARALAVAVSQGDPKVMLRCALSAAQGAASRESWAEAVGILEPLVGALGAASAADGVDAALLLGASRLMLGDAAGARAALEKAVTLVDGAGLAPGERVNYLASLCSLTEDPVLRRGLLERAQKAAGEAGLDVLKQGLSQELADLQMADGDLAAAEQTLTGLVADEEAKRDRLAFDPLLRQQWFAAGLEAYRRLSEVAALRGNADLAFSCGERMRARSLMDELAWRMVDVRVDLPRAVREQLASLKTARVETYALLQQATGVEAGVGLGDDPGRGAYMPIRGCYIPIRGCYIPIRGGDALGEEPVAPAGDTALLRARLDALAQQESALESVLREHIPAYEFAGRLQLPSGEELQAILAQDPGLAVLEYTLTGNGVTVVGVRGGQAAKVAFLKEPGPALRERVGRFRDLIWDKSDQVPTEATALYELLVAPMGNVLTGATRLWVVSDGALQSLPFAALRDRSGRYLAQRLAVATVPSLTVALYQRGERPKAELSAAVIAAPDTGAGAGSIPGEDPRGAYMPVRGAYMPVRGEGGVSSTLDLMASIPLPGAESEGRRVAERFPGASLAVGKEATKERFYLDGANCEVLHLATHGYVDPEIPEFSGLLFAGQGEKSYEVLTAQEVYGWSLNARLVTLSACQTGLGKTVEGEGLLGLSRAFIAAGAQDVVCSLWPVADVSTEKLMVAMYSALPGSASIEEALKKGQEALLADPATAHPYYWAAFVPIHGPRAG